MKELLRAAIEAAGQPQSFVSWKAGITEKHLSRILTGNAPLSVRVALQLEAALGNVTAEALLVAQVRDLVAAGRLDDLDAP